MVVAQYIAFVDEVADDGFDAQRSNAGQVGLDRLLTLPSVTLRE